MLDGDLRSRGRMRRVLSIAAEEKVWHNTRYQPSSRNDYKGTTNEKVARISNINGNYILVSKLIL